MSEWISVEDHMPEHCQKVITLDSLGRQFECEFFDWMSTPCSYFKLIGQVWDHSNVTHWKPLLEQPEE